MPHKKSEVLVCKRNLLGRRRNHTDPFGHHSTGSPGRRNIDRMRDQHFGTRYVAQHDFCVLVGFVSLCIFIVAMTCYWFVGDTADVADLGLLAC